MVHKSLLLLFYFIIILASSCIYDKPGSKEDNSTSAKDTAKLKPNPYANAEIAIKIFRNDTVKNSNLQGFGYDIYIFKSKYVSQPHIPAINGNRGFSTGEQARQTAEFIVYKIRNNIMPPSVTVEELDSLGVLK